jgi:superfamily II DNA/RNA helicase
MLKRPPNRSIGILVISPTRELAAQIAEEAKQLTKFQEMRIQAWHHLE